MKNKEIHSKLLENLNKTLEANKVQVHLYENFSSVQFTLEEFFDHYNPEEVSQKGQCNLMFKVSISDVIVAAFNLRDMPNCCGIAIGSDLFVHPDFRNRGVGAILTKFMEDFSRYYGYGVLQGNDKENNEHQRRIFEKFKWRKSETFINPKTKNTLIIWLLNLN